MRCTICREKLPHSTPRWWRQSHYQSLHADYARSIGRWYRNFFAILGPFLLTLILTEYLWFSCGGLYITIWGVTILSFIVFVFMRSITSSAEHPDVKRESGTSSILHNREK